MEIGKVNYPNELQSPAELHPSWLSGTHSQAQGIFKGMQSQFLIPYLEMEQGSKLIPAQTQN